MFLCSYSLKKDLTLHTQVTEKTKSLTIDFIWFIKLRSTVLKSSPFDSFSQTNSMDSTRSDFIAFLISSTKLFGNDDSKLQTMCRYLIYNQISSFYIFEKFIKILPC